LLLGHSAKKKNNDESHEFENVLSHGFGNLFKKLTQTSALRYVQRLFVFFLNVFNNIVSVSLIDGMHLHLNPLMLVETYRLITL